MSPVEPPIPLSWTRPPCDAELPPGCSLCLESRSLDLGDGLLAGGAPFRLMRLTPKGEELVAGWQHGKVLGSDPSEVRLATHLVNAGVLNPTWTTTPWSPRDVTVVIPHHNRVRQLDQLLCQLDGHSVIVVDDVSDDRVGLRETTERHGADLIVRSLRGGPGAARNTGLKAARTPFVVFIDTDCSVQPGWLEPLLAQMTDPSVGLVAPRIVGPPGQSPRAMFEHGCSPLDLGSNASVVRPLSAVSFVPAAVLLVRRELGPHLFDESLKGGEDVDLVWRMNDLGWVVRYEPSSVVEHAMRNSLKAWMSQRHFYGTTAAALEARHGEAAAPLGGSAWTLASWTFAGLGHVLCGALLFSIGLEQLRRKLAQSTDHPGKLAWRLASRNLTTTGPGLARQVVRTYGPALLVGSLFSRSLRRLSLVAFLVAGIDRWRSTQSHLDLTSFVMWSTIDDLVYSTGLWQGAYNERRPGALLPRVARSNSRFLNQRRALGLKS